MRRVAILGLVALLALVVALTSVRAGVTPLGSAAPDDQACLQAMSESDSSQPNYALLRRTHATQTWLPLGLICSMDTIEPGGSALEQRYQSWGATYVAVGALGVVALTSGLLLRERRRRP